MKEKRKPFPVAAEVEKITFRLWAPYSNRIAQQALAARVKPNQFARIATMCVVDGELLNLSERIARIEEELTGLRRDFNEAVDRQENESGGGD